MLRHEENQSNLNLKSLLGLALLAVLISPMLGVSSAEARIKCHNGYQIVQGNQLATPYCQDKLLARVARQYGTKVSAREIRNNPNLKRNICVLIGRDIRVQENCNTVLPVPRGRF